MRDISIARLGTVVVYTAARIYRKKGNRGNNNKAHTGAGYTV